MTEQVRTPYPGEYPKWVDSDKKDANGNFIRVVINNPDEEKEMADKVAAAGGGKPQEQAWGK